MAQLLVLVFNYLQKKKWLPIVISILLFAVLAFLALQLKIENDLSKLIPGNSSLEKINELQASSGLYDKIIFKIKSPSADDEKLIAAADFLEQKINEKLQPLTKEIKIHIDETSFFDVQETVAQNLPCFLDSSDYKRLDTLLLGDNIATKIQNNAELLNTISGIGAKRFFVNDPLGLSLASLKKMQSLQVDDRIELNNGYLFTDDGKSVLAFVTLKDSVQAQNADQVVALLHTIKTEVASEYKDLNVYVYGGLLVANSNKVQLQKDTKLTLSLTIIGIVLLTLISFKRKRMPFLMLLPAVFGIAFALAFVYLIQGNISGISLGAGAVVLGITINFSIHFFTHLSSSNNIRQTISELWMPLTLGSFTTIASFFALTLLSSPILHDFGLFAGLTLLGAVLFTLFLLPQFSPEKFTVSEKKSTSFFNLNSNLKKKLNIAAFIAIIVVTVLLLPFISKVEFDSDLNKLNYTNEEVKAAENEILWLQNDTAKTVFIASSAKDLQTALQQNEALTSTLEHFENKGAVTKFSSFSMVLPSHQAQQKRLQFWNEYWSSTKKNIFLQKVTTALSQAGFNNEFIESYRLNLFKHYNILNNDAEHELLSILGNGLVAQNTNITTVFSSVTVEKDKREKVYAAIQKLNGIILLDKQIISNAIVDVLHRDFNDILTYTIFIVSIALLLGYGRIELALVTFIPMLLSWIWILGIMGFAGIHFNIINIVISTFIFGLGDDFSIFISDGLIGKYKDGKAHMQTHRLSILLCAIATLLGLGTLYFGKHPALKSIAIVSIIGIVSVYIIGQIVQPILFNYFVQNRKEKKLAPWTLPTLVLAVCAFCYFVFTAFLLTALGYILLYALPFIPKRKRKYWYHILLCNFVKSLVYLMANVKKVHINKQNMDFGKPAIIVANHTSFLDILVVAMQNPKLILLTNKWVYYSPFFGKVVQLADYYPVMEGVDPAIEKFEKIVAEGYSIAIFPEGTRSVDGKLKRFHKGAFFLAEKLNLDIAPLVLHGINNTMQKGDFMLYNGTMTMKFLPRISPNNNEFGNGYAERTKGISKLFKTELNKLNNKIETPEYFAQKLLSNYWYKGFTLELSAKKFTKRTALIQVINEQIPKQGNILELGSGYGFYTYMLFLLSSERTITAIETDEEKTAIAANCYMANNQLKFISSFSAIEQQNFDTILVHQETYLEQLKQFKSSNILFIKNTKNETSSHSNFNWQSIGIFDGFEAQKLIE